MDRNRFISGALLAAWMLLCCAHAFAQQPHASKTSEASPPGAAGNAQGILVVMATVVTSVGLVIGPDGEQRMILANAADPVDNVSRLQPVMVMKLTPVDARTNRPPKVRKKKH
jgi:hypothetical protein